MKFKLDHMCSNVVNLETTIDFYTNVVGGKLLLKSVDKETNSKSAIIQIADGLLELNEDSITENKVYGLEHIAFEVDNIDDAYEFLTSKGFNFVTKPKPAKSGNGRIAFFKDTNNVIVELLQRDTPLLLEEIDSPVIKSFDHYALITDDLKEAHNLYHKILQMNNLAHFMVEEHQREIMYLDHGTVALEIYTSPSIKNPTNPHAHISLRVNNINDAVEQLKLRGAKFKDNAINVPGIKFGLSASFHDPDGVRIELVDRPDLHDFDKLGITPDNLPAMRKF